LDFSFKYFESRYKLPDVSPERLAFIAKVFDTICEIRAIPPDAKDEREALALNIILNSRTVTDEGKLIELARKASERYRREDRKPSLKVVYDQRASPKKPPN
jgi:hypothetical protein